MQVDEIIDGLLLYNSSWRTTLPPQCNIFSHRTTLIFYTDVLAEVTPPVTQYQLALARLILSNFEVLRVQAEQAYIAECHRRHDLDPATHARSPRLEIGA